LFDKSLGSKNDRKVRRYRNLGYRLTAIDEESTGFFARPDLFLSLRLSDDSLERAERWFCLSDHIRGYAERIYPAHAGKFVTTGMPRTDIWRPEYRALFAGEVEELRRRHGDYLLFCSNFGTVIHTRRGQFLDRQFDRWNRINPETANFRKKTEEEIYRNLLDYEEMLPQLRAWFPGRKLIIRPHPSEDRDYWRAIAAKIDGAEVHDGGIATPWILASAAMVHHGCTTGIEAELLGKAHVMYAPHPDAHHDTEIMQAFAPIEKTLAGLRERFTSILAGNHRPRDREALQRYYASLVGPLASQKVVDEIEEIAFDDGDLSSWLPLMRYSPRHLYAQYGPRTKAAKAYSRQKWQGVSLEEVNRLLGVIAGGAALKARLAADEVFPQLFRVEARKK
jgi:surface carbohydrate biosynthesis protein